MAGGDDLVDKSWPVMWPFHLQNVDQGHVELVEECTLLAEALFGVRTLNDEVNDEVADAWYSLLADHPW